MKLRIEHFTYLLTLIVILLAGCSGCAQKNVEQPIVLKPSPPGETFATGHWDGDKWHRTVPPEPETITYEGKALPLDELFSTSFAFDTSWEERVAILNRIIAEAPYSIYAFEARLYLATHDENGKSIHDDALLFERLQPLLKYHFDSPGLLHELLVRGRKIQPEAAIRYGKEALKYVDMYRMDSGYGAFPERIHHFLGYAYQEIGDYNTALEHLNQALKLYIRVRNADSRSFRVKEHIEQILIENPILGPLSDGSAPGLSERVPDSKQSITDTDPIEQIALKPPPPGETFATGHWDGDKWHRTVPPEPKTITYEGEALTKDELFSVSFGKSWEEKVAILKRIIAEAPYSKDAFEARLHLATHDENGKDIRDYGLLFERLQPLLKYHFDSPRLLHALLFYSRHSHPEAAIRYGKEALKYVDMYRMESDYGAFPESIHHFLGYAYQEIGDDSTALEHFNQALKLYTAVHQGRMWGTGSGSSIVKRHRDRILEGNPALGPLSKNPLLPEKKYVIGSPD